MKRRSLLKGLGIFMVASTLSFGFAKDLFLESQLRVIEIHSEKDVLCVIFKYQENIWHKIKRTLNSDSGYTWGEDIFLRDFIGYDFNGVSEITYLRDYYPEKLVISPDEIVDIGGQL